MRFRGCIHGDVNNDSVIDSTDEQFVLDYWVRKVGAHSCILKSGDINLDG
ncbi:MAG: dockerin type I domain-containing protein [Candidatus Hydrogenedens sp.]